MSVQPPDVNPTAWPPSTMPAANTTHPSAVPQTYVKSDTGALSDGRDVASLGYDASSAAGSSVTYASTATGGTPGSFGAGDKPNSAADLIAGRPNAVTGGANWTAGQYVTTENGDRAYWNGTAWVAGTHP